MWNARDCSPEGLRSSQISTEDRRPKIRLGDEFMIAIPILRPLQAIINGLMGERLTENYGFNGRRSQKSLTAEGDPVDYLDRGGDTERLLSSTTD